MLINRELNLFINLDPKVLEIIKLKGWFNQMKKWARNLKK